MTEIHCADCNKLLGMTVCITHLPPIYCVPCAKAEQASDVPFVFNMYPPMVVHAA